MRIYNYGRLPKDTMYTHADISSLDEHDVEEIRKLDIDAAWYWYVSESYEGAGQLLMRRGDKYDVHNMGHCSCYGPTEHVIFCGRYASLDEIQQCCSTEAYKAIAPLVEMARRSKSRP